MRKLLGCIAFLSTTTLLLAAFRPLELHEKTKLADLIAVGKVERIVRVSPLDGFVNVVDDVAYLGPGSIAVVAISEAWATPDHSHFTEYPSHKPTVPRFVYIPCDYGQPESPCDLTKGRDYVLFLKYLGENLYTPVDPASTHILENDLVQEFGMNHISHGIPGTRSAELEEFKTRVIKLLEHQNNGEP